MEKCFRHLFITSSSSHFFNKTNFNFEQFLFNNLSEQIHLNHKFYENHSFCGLVIEYTVEVICKLFQKGNYFRKLSLLLLESNLPKSVRFQTCWKI